jgi:hypothetical protein
MTDVIAVIKALGRNLLDSDIVKLESIRAAEE